MSAIRRSIREITRYPSALAGLGIITGLVILSIYTLITIPYSEAIRLWRGGEEVWYNAPKNAPPVWVNLFRKEDLPPTIIMDSRDDAVKKVSEVTSEGLKDVTISFPFQYAYDDFPQEISVFFTSKYRQKQPFVSIYWYTPDGREIRLGEFSVISAQSYRVSLDSRLRRRLEGISPEIGLFVNPDAETPVLLRGPYEMRVSVLTFEEDSNVEAEFVLFGKVYGLAGTDHRRRDLTVALLWGTPIALSFGLLAALGSTFSTMLIAAIGVWFAGWVDELIQRITEVNLILPVLPVLIMVGAFYSRSIWLMLGVIILLNIFGGGIKTFRAIFLQVKASPYIEAAQAYGASNWRIILLYLIPRIIPVLVPQLVTLVPTFVFLEASLAVLGLGDPVIPTWGKVIDDARSNGALYQGNYYWMLEPAILLVVTGFAFAIVGFALDRIFNPRLREL